MFRHEDIIIVVSYYEKLGRGYRPSRASFVCVFGGEEEGLLVLICVCIWGERGGFFSGVLFASFVGGMITSN